MGKELNEKWNSDELFIIKRMIDGDKQAFRYFFDKYYAELCNFVNIYLKDTVLSEEVVQDIFVYFWENKSKIKVSSSVRSYLFSATKYRSLNMLREQKSFERLKEKIKHEKSIVPDQELETFPNVEDFRNLLDKAIQELPDKCRTIFLLSKKEELSNKEIASRLNISVKTVESQMTIALKKLRSTLYPHREKLFVLFLTNRICE